MTNKLRLALSLFALMLSLSINAAIISGPCGKHATYRLEEDGTLYIEGNGDIETTPWQSKSAQIVTLQIADGITSIEAGAFWGCTALTSVTIPNSVTLIRSYAFQNCKSLTSITIPNTVTNIGFKVFEGCSALTSISIPSSVKSIGSDAFNGCTGLTSVNIPSSVTSIGDGAFAGCSGLTSITIPSSVTSIGDGVFRDCGNIKAIHCQSSTPPIAKSNAFEAFSTNHCKLYVPVGAMENYAYATGWMNFQYITEEGDSDKEYLTIKKKNGTTLLIPMDEIEEISPVLEKIVEVPVEVEKEVTIYVYDDSRSEIKLASGETITLNIIDGIVNIENAPKNSLITVYTTNGEMYAASRVADTVTSFSLPRNSIYIITVGDKTFKVKL